MPATPSGLTIGRWQQFTSLPQRNRPLYREGGRHRHKFFTFLPTQTQPARMRGQMDGQTISVFLFATNLFVLCPIKCRLPAAFAPHLNFRSQF